MHAQDGFPLQPGAMATQWWLGPPLKDSVTHTSVFVLHFVQSVTVLHCCTGTQPPQHRFSTSGTSPAGQIGVAFLQVTLPFEESQSNIVQCPAEHATLGLTSWSALQVDWRQFGMLHFGGARRLDTEAQLQQSFSSVQSAALLHSGAAEPPESPPWPPLPDGTPPPLPDGTPPPLPDGIVVPPAPPALVPPPVEAVLVVVPVVALLVPLPALLQAPANATPRNEIEASRSAKFIEGIRRYCTHLTAIPSVFRRFNCYRLAMRPRAVVVVSAVVGWSACMPNGPGDDPAANKPGATPLATLCEDSCAMTYPLGATAYGALAACLLSGACHDACATEGGSSGGQVESGCSSKSSDCSACIVSPCALEQLPDTSFAGLCAAEGTACAKSSDCVGLNNCIASCIVTTGPGGAGGMHG